MKSILVFTILVGSSGFALAQATPSTEMKSNTNCQGGMSESQARYAADNAGFEPATNLTLNSDCNWVGGSAAKGYFSVDKSGRVTTRQQ